MTANEDRLGFNDSNDDLSTVPLLRNGNYNYGTNEDGLGETEALHLLASTDGDRRWIGGRPVGVPSSGDIAPLDPIKRQRSIEEQQLIANEAVEEEAKTQKLKHRDRLTIAVLAFANLFSVIVYSCIAPFFPEEAKRKGASATAIGFIFGIFELVVVLVAPIYGRYLTQLGSKFTFGTGLCATGVTSILLGLLRYSPPGSTFIALCLVVLSVEAVADAGFVTASFAIASSSFPLRVSTVIGVLETFAGLGYTVGPPIGGALYELGGFSLPFWVLGGTLLVAGFSCVYLIPKQRDVPRAPVGNIFGLMRSPRTCLMVLLVFVSNASFAFLDPTLEPHLTAFQLTPLLVGLMFLLSGGFYAATAPLWGYLTDRKEDWADAVMLFGSVCSTVAFLFLGPSPFFLFEKQLWLIGVSLVIMGLGISAQMIPAFQQCFLEARKQTYPDSFETYSLVSSLFQCAVSLGAFCGPAIGGILVEHIGFGWSTVVLSLLNFLCVILLAIDMIYTRVLHVRKEILTSRSPELRS